VAAAVVDEQCVTAELRRRDCVQFLRAEVVVVAGEQELEIERCESSEAGFREPLRVDLRLGLGEKFVVVLPKNRALRGDGFEPLAMKMVCEFTSELVKLVEVGIEVIAGVVRADETAIAKSLEDAVDRVAVVVAPVGDFGDRPRLVEIVEYLEGLPGQQLGELDMGVLADEILVNVDCPGVRGNDPLSAAVTFRVDEPLLDEVSDSTRKIALAVVELRREFGDRVAAVDGGEDLKLDAPEYDVTQYETGL
jgi:hypothetical protein